MKRILIFMLIAMLPVVGLAQSKKNKKAADKETVAWRYEIEPVTVGLAGTVVVKVWCFSKDPNVAMEQAKKNAVHGVVFKGIPTKDRITGRKPIAEAGKESEFGDFFKGFFANGGGYMKYVTLTNSGAIAPGDVMKIGKEYKVGVVVTVSYDDLRKALEGEGIVKKLDSGF